MRSSFFQQPLEHQIEVEGETWNQGEALKGRLRVRNMSSTVVDVKTTQLILAHGLKKDLKKGGVVPWEVKDKLILTKNISLSAAEEHTCEWEFDLPSDCPITDKQGGLFLLFGGEDALSKGGLLDLQISLHPILQNFLQTFTTQFRFLLKHQKRKLEWTEVKLVPPESREFPNMDYVMCFLRIHEEQLTVQYRFKMSGLGRTGEIMTVTKKNREVEQIISSENYLLPGGYPNRTFFRENIDQALDIARPEVMF
ncbi:MAG: hypothetical protein H8E38_05430 [SAR324 cluster bacterium]|nr:hypothetical protein [SAR324 cluster bacterium]MBL7034148.1 hypothetical protein [SAR324 cluster bacterium]